MTRSEPYKTNRTLPDQTVLKINPEPPKKVQYNRDVVTRAASSNNQGVITFDRGDYKIAIEHFRTAIKADSKFAVAHYNLGCTFLKMKDYPKAISAFSDAVDVNRGFKEAYYNLGLAHIGKGAYSAAKISVELALNIDRNYQHARNLLSAIEKAQR